MEQERKFKRGDIVRICQKTSAALGKTGEVTGFDKRGELMLYAVRADGLMVTLWFYADELSLVQPEEDRGYAGMAQTSSAMHDSGERQTFTTGAVRDTAGDKPRPDLFSPFALNRIGDWLGIGAKKYDERNWEKGMPISRVIASLMRHLLAYMMGKKDEDHMAAVATNAMFILHYEAMIERGVLPKELNDMPNYKGDK
jgi:hypothetical protein